MLIIFNLLSTLYLALKSQIIHLPLTKSKQDWSQVKMLAGQHGLTVQ